MDFLSRIARAGRRSVLMTGTATNTSVTLPSGVRALAAQLTEGTLDGYVRETDANGEVLGSVAQGALLPLSSTARALYFAHSAAAGTGYAVVYFEPLET